MPRELADFNLNDERVEFRDMLRRFFDEHAPIAEVRAVMESGTGLAPDAWKLACEELGLAGIAIPESAGGQGFGAKELAIALAEVGRCLAPIPLFASAALAGRVVQGVSGDAQAEEWLGPIAAGGLATLAWVEASGDWDPAAVALEVGGAPGSPRLSGAKHFVLDAAHAERIFVVARQPGSAGDAGLGLFAAEADAPGVEVTRHESLDITRPMASLRLDDVAVRAIGSVGEAGVAIRRGLEEATALLAAEMVGGLQKVLETSVAYAAERHQFSRPIGSFQAVKHKCADMLIGFEGARTASDAAIVAIDEDDPERTELASVAKAHVGPVFVRAAIESMQIQGGVGYTWEYDAHLYYRRAVASEAWLGDARAHCERLARAVARRTAGSTGALAGGAG